MKKNSLASIKRKVKFAAGWAVLNFAVISFLIGGTLTSCRDEMEEMFIEEETDPVLSRATSPVNNTSGLEQDARNGHWTARQRVPLVGMGRIVDNMQGSLLAVGSLGDASKASNPDRMIDLDLGNTFIPDQAVLGVGTPTHIVSIRDLNHIYAGGQKAGFLCKKLSKGVLRLDVLQGYWISTYLKGVATGDKVSFSQATDLIDLGVGNISSHEDNEAFCVEGTFTKPFDEIRLGNTGIKVGALNADLEIYYAYVGENPKIPAVNNGNAYFNNKVTAGGFHAGESKLIDANLSNGIATGITLVYNATRMKVNFGRTVPAGTEVGFVATQESVLDISAGLACYVQTWRNGMEVAGDRYDMAQVLGLKLLGGGRKYFSLITKQDCDAVEFFYGAGGIKLSNLTVLYAYVREAVELDPSSYFTVANGKYYTPYSRFANPYLGGKVTYTVNPASASQDAEVHGDETNGYYLNPMNKTGNYYIKGQYTIPGTSTPVEQDAVIVRNKNYYGAGIPLINTGGDTYTASVPSDGFKGAIVVGGGTTAADTVKAMGALVDEDLSNKLTFKTLEIANLISNKALLSVKKDQGSINPSTTKVRAGLVIDKGANILNLDVLKFLRIKLLKGGKEVNTKVPLENQGIGLSLIGKETGKIRLGVITSDDFDEIQLFNTGLLHIKLEQFSVYYAFKEEVNDKNSNADDEYIQLISNANYGAKFRILGAGLADVLKLSSNMGNAVDGDKETFASLGGVLGAASEMSVEVAFDKVKKDTELGMIVSYPVGVDLSLISAIRLLAYNDDQEIKTSGYGTDGGLLKLKVLGSGNKVYYSVVPAQPCNKLVLQSGDGVTLGNILKLYGAFIRPHVPDIKDDVNADITRLDMIWKDSCQSAVNAIIPTGGEDGNQYELIIKNDVGEKYNQPTGLKIDPVNGVKVFDIPDTFWHKLEPGKYTVICDDTYATNKPCKSETSFTVHPLETTWLGNSSDWDDWSNWDNGTPWRCTNVILPVGKTVYPELISVAYCNNIHFEDGAQLLGQSHLQYGGIVTIDKNVKGGEYRLMSSPLTGTVTGDMFVLAQSEQETWKAQRLTTETLDHHKVPLKHINYFSPLTEAGYKEHRIDPVIYQRFWSRTVTNFHMSRATPSAPDAMVADWSGTFNAVATPYEAGTGFGIRFGEDKDAKEYQLHFPKHHTIYHYYSLSGDSLAQENVRSDADLKNSGKLLTTTSFTLNRDKKGDWFLFGNPYMAAIDIQKFFEKNKKVTSAYVFVNGQYQVITPNGGTSATGVSACLPPMTAMFIQTSDGAVEVSEDIQCQMSQSKQLSAAAGAIYLEAACKGNTSSCMLQKVSNGNDAYNEGVDACLLTDQQDKAEISVYTAKGNRQLAIQQMSTLTSIPVGFNLKHEGNEVTVSFKGSVASWEGWRFVDGETGEKYQLQDEIKLKNVSSGADRFSLQKVN